MNNDTTSMLVRFNDDKILKELDEIAEKQKIKRNQLVINILQIFISAKDNDNFVVSCLPLIVHSMVKSEIDELMRTEKDIIKDIYITILKLRRVTEKIDTFLAPEFEKIEYDEMKINEILHLIEQSEKDEK